MDIVTLGASLSGAKKYTDDVVHGIASGITYKGEVNYYSNLPSNPTLGDAYTVKYSGTTGSIPDGTEYVWAENSGVAQWVDFSKDSYTKVETDGLLSGKQDALTQAQLAAVNSGIDSTKVAQIATNASDILDIQTTIGNINAVLEEVL